jgi:hypothetical protein
MKRTSGNDSMPAWRAGRRCAWPAGAAVAFAAILASWPPIAARGAQDQETPVEDSVVFKPGARYSGAITLRGTIVDYTSEEITIRLKNGQERTFPSGEVLEFHTSRTTAWDDADDHVQAHEYILAVTDLQKAFKEEPRPWAQREVLARLAWCYRLQGRWIDAGETFLSIYENDKNTPFFSAIPLEWIGGETPFDLRERARQWLDRRESPVAVLMGASHLLAGPDRAAALEKLGELTKHPEPRIAILAAAQIWRTQIGKAGEDQVYRWEEVIRRLPASLRAGPYYVVGKGYALARRSEQAALGFLWLPLVYDEDPILTAQACLEAGDALAASGHADEAQTLYREVVVRFGFTPAAAEARLLLQGLVPRKNSPRDGGS